ncbi:hypothetical protein BU16DRAFT_151017 [Lophium mytilinum]|uniref:Uncharacterized protein n=1 Tax=Lophium mytilinum TaxID=390894 RepID=A0A6A6QEC9_9PEZI|nr:hypothetical protein BU16DRAFT_151017 [Lophium mytilinum]
MPKSENISIREFHGFKQGVALLIEKAPGMKESASHRPPIRSRRRRCLPADGGSEVKSQVLAPGKSRMCMSEGTLWTSRTLGYTMGCRCCCIPSCRLATKSSETAKMMAFCLFKSYSKCTGRLYGILDRSLVCQGLPWTDIIFLILPARWFPRFQRLQ